MKKLKWISLLGIASIVSMSGCSSPKEDTSLNDILDKGTFVLGLDATFAPMGFVDEQGKIVGFDIDLAEVVATRLGVELVIQPINWDAKSLELNSKNIDAIWNGFTITEERKSEVSFSTPYLNNRQIVLTLDSSIDSIAQLSGKSVGVQLQSSGQNALESNSIFSSIGEEVKFDTYDFAIADLQSGRIDAIVIDEIMGRYMNDQMGSPFYILNEDLGNEQYAIGFRQNDLLLTNRVNEILQEMKDDGTGTAISIKWFGEDIFLTK